MKALTLAASAACFALVLAIFFETGFQSIPGGDSGELAAEACGGGVAHPPGYPLFVLLGNAVLRLWRWRGSLLPPILVLNRMCSVLGALSAAFQTASVFSLARIVRGRSSSSIATFSIALGVGLATAFAPLLWLYNTQTEVFALNNAFVAILLWVLLKAVSAATTNDDAASAQRGLHRWLCIGALVSGLSLCNQHTSILLIAPIMVYCLGLWLWLFNWRLPSLGRSLSYTLLLFVGLLPYAWLPISHAFFRVPGSWGDTTSLKGFIRHFLRQDYGTFKLISKETGDGKSKVEGPLERHLAYWDEIKSKQLTHIALALALLGVVAAAVVAVRAVVGTHEAKAVEEDKKGSKKEAERASGKAGAKEEDAAAFARKAALARHTFPLILVLLLAFYFIVFHGLSNMSLSEPLLYGVHARFWMQPTYIVALLSGYGAIAVADALGKALSSSNSAATPSSAIALVLGSALAATSFRHMLSNYSALDNSGNDALARYGLAMLEPLPPNAILMTGFDMQWTSARYLQQCEGIRPDVSLLNSPVMSFSWLESHRPYYHKRGVSFPGTHLVSHLSATHASGGFSLGDFFVANIAADRGAALVESYARIRPHPQYTEKRPALLAEPLAVGSIPKTATGASNLFYAGVFVYQDQDDHALQFELRPFGIVSHVVPKYAAAHLHLNNWRNITKSAAQEGLDFAVAGLTAGTTKKAAAKRSAVSTKDVAAARAAWAVVENVAPAPSSASAALPLPQPLLAFLPNHTEFVGAIRGSGVVNFTRYDETTWELATRIDTWNQAVVYATWLLEWALDPRNEPGAASKAKAGEGGAKDNDTNEYVHPGAAMEALRLLEQALAMQLEHNSTVSASTYKNIGLACMKLVRSRLAALPDTKDAEGVLQWPMLPLLRQEGLTKAQISEQHFRNAASQRVLDTWSVYLRSSESKGDPGAAAIRNVVKVLHDVATKQQQAAQQQAAQQQAAQQQAAQQQAQRKASGGHK